MNSMTEEKILRETLGNQAPVVVFKFSGERKKYLKTLKERLKGLKTISIQSNRNCYPKPEPGTKVDFSINYPSRNRSDYYDTYTICFNDQHALCLKRGYREDPYHLSGEIQQFEILADQFLIAAEKRDKRQIKAKKVKDLKAAAIMARIREVAAADEFDYYYELQSTKVKLVARIEDTGFVEIDIPFGQFQEKLQRIRDCIRLAREIGDLNVVRSIKYKGVQRDKWEWTSHQDLKNSERL